MASYLVETYVSAMQAQDARAAGRRARAVGALRSAAMPIARGGSDLMPHDGQGRWVTKEAVSLDVRVHLLSRLLVEL
jgi:hypothetical protein